MFKNWGLLARFIANNTQLAQNIYSELPISKPKPKTKREHNKKNWKPDTKIPKSYKNQKLKGK